MSGRYPELEKAVWGIVKFAWGVVVFLGIIWGVADWLKPDKEKIAEEYHVSTDAVVINHKPHGCDFEDAPLGNKHCHYEKTVTAYNAQGLQVGGDQTPLYSNDTNTNKAIISHDNGKSWDWLPDEIKSVDRKVTRVVVIWTKVEDD
jgi:hypothetical protein